MKLVYENLLGKQHVSGKSDWLSMVRGFYNTNFGLEFKNYGVPEDSWITGMDIMRYVVTSEGFNPIDVHPIDMLPGDMLLMARNSLVANHIGILVENYQFIHHPFQGLSRLESYDSEWRYLTLGVFRNSKVASLWKTSAQVDKIDIDKYLQTTL